MSTTIRFVSESTDLFLEFSPSAVGVFRSQLDDGSVFDPSSFAEIVRGLSEIAELGCLPTGGWSAGPFDFVDSPAWTDGGVIRVTMQGGSDGSETTVLGDFDVGDLAEIRSIVAAAAVLA